ncbi:MAG: hypothetical protein WAU64_02320 [Methanoregula sp.]|uniref:hypothetical protein n=1 Tax=Methanoregula sp. TaxID=2052170 RepID=UPI003BAF6A9C
MSATQTAKRRGALLSPAVAGKAPGHNDIPEYRFTGPIRGNAVTSGKNTVISGSVRPSTPVR